MATKLTIDISMAMFIALKEIIERDARRSADLQATIEHDHSDKNEELRKELARQHFQRDNVKRALDIP